MLRKLEITAAIATASVVALAAPASAQTFGGLTLSFGSGGYGGYSYDDDDDDDDDGQASDYAYGYPAYSGYQNRNGYYEDWRAR